MLFGWEFVLSFILVSLVYAVAIGEPSFGNIAPFAAGLSLTVDLFAGAHLSGVAAAAAPLQWHFWLRVCKLSETWQQRACAF